MYYAIISTEWHIHTRVVTDIPYKAGICIYHTNYHGNLLTLVTCENILMDREERLRRNQDTFNGWRDTRID